jgi:hypothetical protein
LMRARSGEASVTSSNGEDAGAMTP